MLELESFFLLLLLIIYLFLRLNKLERYLFHKKSDNKDKKERLTLLKKRLEKSKKGYF